MLEKCQVCRNTIEFEEATVFAPINAAFQNLPKMTFDDDFLVEYHMINVPKKTDQLGTSFSSINTRTSGNPPLWITQSSRTFHNDIYINNAKILLSQSNVIGQRVGPKGTLTQILHKIDEVLIPTRSPSTENTISNPNAWEYLENYESIQPKYGLRHFRDKVREIKKQDVFRTEGAYTFFIPIDDGFVNGRAGLVDDKVIDGHVIPKQVLFTTPTPKDVGYQTIANGDNAIRVIISFTQEKRGESVINYVKSHTLFSDSKHTSGVVLAEIVKANIPVKNGVIHLIHKPLVIVDATIKELLQEHMDYICRVGNVQMMQNIMDEGPEIVSDDSYDSYGSYDPNRPYDSRYSQNHPYVNHHVKHESGGLLNSFYKLLTDDYLGNEGKEFLRTLEKSKDVTLFAPCNDALDGSQVSLQHIMRDKQRFLEILKLHLVVDNRLDVETVLKQNQLKIFQVPTLAIGRTLYFNVVTIGNNRTMTVEGGGVNATVIQPDLAAKNGIIHIIDKVLGVSYNTVLDKLRSDPMLKRTFLLGQVEGFNNQLNDTTKKFTYFVPRDQAWNDVNVVMPSAIKALFMKDFPFLATETLQRHLVISNEVYTMERIKQLTKINENDQNMESSDPPKVELQTVRDTLRIYVEERIDNKSPNNSTEPSKTTFFIHWKGLVIPVFRPNVECTNGIIHVIDRPFLQKGDIRVSGSAILKPSAIVALIASTVFVKVVLQ